MSVIIWQPMIWAFIFAYWCCTRIGALAYRNYKKGKNNGN